MSITGMHFGRSWHGHKIEDRCDCPQAPCGLVDGERADCPEHGLMASKTIRQMHDAKDCPGEAKP